MAKKSHQRVIKTRWWMLVGGWNDEEKPPTSCNNSLVIEVAGRWVERQRKATNESL